MALAEQVNASRVRALFQGRRGRHASASEVRAAFDADFGRGAGDRVRLVCEEGMVSEIRLSLKGTIGEGSRIGPLMQAAPTLSNSARGDAWTRPDSSSEEPRRTGGGEPPVP